jgi:hypothetical protein
MLPAEGQQALMASRFWDWLVLELKPQTVAWRGAVGAAKTARAKYEQFVEALSQAPL